MPEWLVRQFDKAEKIVSSWPLSKRVAAGVEEEMSQESRWERFSDEELEVVSLALLDLNWVCIDDSQPHYRMMKEIQAELDRRKEESAKSALARISAKELVGTEPSLPVKEELE